MQALEELIAKMGRENWVKGHEFEGQTIMVTGAGGSIGSALCKYLAIQGAARLVLVELNEFALYEVNRKMVAAGVITKPVLGSYGSPRLLDIMEDYKPSLCFHAGAYKHVPLVEENGLSAVDNNVIETVQLIANIKRLQEPPKLIVISSDKSVHPSTIMGATKALVEHICLREIPSSKVVRFGNVLGSSGSVIPLFYEQLSQGKPVTLTDERVTRYFMSTPEAVSLVVGCNQLQGRRFLLSMGEPKSILELAKWVASEMGVPLKYKVIGLREGEKLHEELCLGNAEPTKHERILSVDEDILSKTEIDQCVETLRNVKETPELKEALSKMSIGYKERAPFNRLSIVGLDSYDNGQDFPNCFSPPIYKE